MKKGTRLYINLTNKCNTACPFCCMYSGPEKNTFLKFERYKEIIDEHSNEDGFELQLEGGEPLLHKDLYLFMEYAISTGYCNKIIILTNGILLENHIKRIASIANWYNIKIEFKVSINYWLLTQDRNILKKLNRLLFATEFIPNINIVFNVRKRKEDDENNWLEVLLKNNGLYEKSNIYYLQSYGKMTDSDYAKPVIVQNIDAWKLYASDGTCFEQNLIARSEYEKEL